MNEADQLITVAEIAIALAGFAGIIATFQAKNGMPARRGVAVGLAMMVNVSLLNAGFCALSLVLLNFELESSQVWGISSTLMGLNYIVVMYYITRRLMHGMTILRKGSKFFVFSLMSTNTVIGLSVLANGLGIGFNQEYAPYFVSVVYPLFVVRFMFSRMLMHPIWKSIRQHEAND